MELLSAGPLTHPLPQIMPFRAIPRLSMQFTVPNLCIYFGEPANGEFKSYLVPALEQLAFLCNDVPFYAFPSVYAQSRRRRAAMTNTWKNLCC